MGRKKRFEESELLQIFDKYLMTEPVGKISYVGIATWAKEQGYDVAEQHFRRCKAIQEKIRNHQVPYPEHMYKDAAFVSIPIAAMVKRAASGSAQSLNTLISELESREEYFKTIFQRYTAQMKVTEDVSKEFDALCTQNQELTLAVSELKDQIIALQKQNKSFTKQLNRARQIIKESIYPEMDLALLDELGLDIEKSKMPTAALNAFSPATEVPSITNITKNVIPFIQGSDSSIPSKMAETSSDDESNQDIDLFDLEAQLKKKFDS